MAHHPPLIIKIGGAALENEVTAPSVWKAIAQIHTARAGGVVLVHGGGQAVDRHLERLGLTSERRDGIRVTPPEHVEEIAAVLAGKINKSIVGELAKHQVKAVGVCLSDGMSFKVIRSKKYAFDAGRVGEVVQAHGFDGGLLRVLLKGHFLPVVSSIGLDEKGFLNVNADDAAAALARELSGAALILLTDVPGILDGDKRVVGETTALDIEAMISAGSITGGMIVKARAAAATAASTGVPVVILSGNNPSSLADWSAGRKAGTRVVPTEGARS